MSAQCQLSIRIIAVVPRYSIPRERFRWKAPAKLVLIGHRSKEKDQQRGSMRPPKKPFPLAACTLCGFLTNRLRAIGFQCLEECNGQRCEGLIVGAPVEGWSECPKCSGTGNESEAKCVRCGGWGWHYRRRYAS